MALIINRKNARLYALACSIRMRNGRFKRVSGQFLADLNVQLRIQVKEAVQRQPSVGMTIR